MMYDVQCLFDELHPIEDKMSRKTLVNYIDFGDRAND